MYTSNFGGTTEFCCPEFFQTGRFENSMKFEKKIKFYLFNKIVVNHLWLIYGQ